MHTHTLTGRLIAGLVQVYTLQAYARFLSADTAGASWQNVLFHEQHVVHVCVQPHHIVCWSLRLADFSMLLAAFIETYSPARSLFPGALCRPLLQTSLAQAAGKVSWLELFSGPV